IGDIKAELGLAAAPSVLVRDFWPSLLSPEARLGCRGETAEVASRSRVVKHSPFALGAVIPSIPPTSPLQLSAQLPFWVLLWRLTVTAFTRVVQLRRGRYQILGERSWPVARIPSSKIGEVSSNEFISCICILFCSCCGLETNRHGCGWRTSGRNAAIMAVLSRGRTREACGFGGDGR
ncbi:hypothetical protein CGCVW01_v003002, partial [Colletotrichum viniferum]